MPFFVQGLFVWIVFWGGALGIVAASFGNKSRVMWVMLGGTGLMLIAAIVTPILPAVR